jgi:hypothetical protein
MAIRAKEVTKEFLQGIEIEDHADNTVSHGFIIENVLDQLTKHGYSIEKEMYRANLEGTTAEGVYLVSYNNPDEDMNMVFAWSNSYDKSAKFKFAIGGSLKESMNLIVAVDATNSGPKSIRTIEQETIQNIFSLVINAQSHFDNLDKDVSIMKSILLKESQVNQFIGSLYLQYDIISTEQISIIKKEMDKSSFNYGVDPNSLWAVYNNVSHSLKKANPKNRLNLQSQLQTIVNTTFDLINHSLNNKNLNVNSLENNYGQPSNQKNILLEIEKVESDELIKEVVEEAATETETVNETPIKESEKEKTIVILTEDELASQLYGVDNDPEYSATLIEDKVEVEVEEVKPTETEAVETDDKNFDNFEDSESIDNETSTEDINKSEENDFEDLTFDDSSEETYDEEFEL